MIIAISIQKAILIDLFFGYLHLPTIIIMCEAKLESCRIEPKSVNPAENKSKKSVPELKESYMTAKLP